MACVATRFFAVAVLAAAEMSIRSFAQESILKIDAGTLTSAAPTTPGGTLAPQPLAVTHRERGAFLDGTLRESWPAGLQIAANASDPAAMGDAMVGDVRLFNGQYAPTEIELALPCPGPRWVVGRTRRPVANGVGQVHGNGWFQLSQSELIYQDVPGSLLDRVFLCYGGDRYGEFVRVLDAQGGSTDVFRGVNGTAGAVEKVVYQLSSLAARRTGVSSSGGEVIPTITLWVFHDPVGMTATYFGDNSLSGGMNASWQIWKMTDASGFTSYVGNPTDPSAAIAAGYDGYQRITNAYDSAGRHYVYTYITVGTNKRLGSIVAYPPGGSTSGPIAARVDYEYYGGTTSSLGTPGDLKLATVTTPAGTGNLTETTAYRYWTTASPASYDGFARGPARSVRLVVGPEGWRRGGYDSGSWANTGISDQSIAEHADHRLGYDSSGRVAQLSHGGLTERLITFSYASSSPAPPSNNGYDTAWLARTIATISTLEGGTWTPYRYSTTYFDEVGQALSSIVTKLHPSVTTSQQTWVAHVVRDAGGRVVSIGTPKSVGAYTHANATFTLGPGLVRTFARETAQTELTGFARLVNHRTAVQGAETTDTQFTYLPTSGTGTLMPRRSVLGYNVYRPLLAGVTRYAVGGPGDTGQTTGYAYHLYSTDPGTDAALAIEWIDVSHPAIPTEEHGSNVPTRSAVAMLENGLITFVRERGDAHGPLSYREYHLPGEAGSDSSGLLRQFHEDISESAYASLLPSGFPGGAVSPHERTTGFEYDAQGREISRLLPGGLKTKTGHSRLADGRAVTTTATQLQDSNQILFGSPGELRVVNLAGRIEASGVVAFGAAQPAFRGVATTDTPPDQWVNSASSDPFACLAPGFGAQVRKGRAWATDKVGARVQEFRKYHEMPAGGGTGTVHTHYEPTTYGYDDLGRVLTAKDPSDTIDTVEYDLLDRPVRVRRGVENGAQVLTGELEYDGAAYGGTGSGGNSLLTKSVRFPNADGTDSRATLYMYDDRDRLKAIANPLSPHVLFARDNLGRTTATGVYSGTQASFVTQAAAATNPVTETANRLALRVEKFDPLSQLWRREDTAQTGGSPRTLATDWWYDAQGRLALTHGATTDRFTYDDCNCSGGTQYRCVIPTYGTTGFGYTQAMALLGSDIVLEQWMTLWDWQNNRAIANSHLERFPTPSLGACDLGGALADPAFIEEVAQGEISIDYGATCNARADVTAHDYDSLNRPVSRLRMGDPRRPGNAATTIGIKPSEYHPGFEGSGSSEQPRVRADYSRRSNTGDVTESSDEKGGSRSRTWDDAGRVTGEMSKLGIGQRPNPCEAGDGDGDSDPVDDEITIDYDKDRIREICFGGCNPQIDPTPITITYPDDPNFDPTRVCAGGLCSADPNNDNNLPKQIILPGSQQPGMNLPGPGDIFDLRHNAIGEISARSDSAGVASVMQRDTMGRPANTYFEYPRDTDSNLITDATGLPLVAPIVDSSNTQYDAWGRVSDVSQMLAAIGNPGHSTIGTDGWGNIESYAHDFTMAGNSGPMLPGLPASLADALGTRHGYGFNDGLTPGGGLPADWRGPRRTETTLPGTPIGGNPDINIIYAGDVQGSGVDLNTMIGRVGSIGLEDFGGGPDGTFAAQYGYYGIYLPAVISDPISGFKSELFNPGNVGMALVPADPGNTGLNPWGESSVDRWKRCAGGNCGTPDAGAPSPFDVREKDPPPQNICACTNVIDDYSDPREDEDFQIICSGMVVHRTGASANGDYGQSILPGDWKAAESWKLRRGNKAERLVKRPDQNGQLETVIRDTRAFTSADQVHTWTRYENGVPPATYQPRYDARGNLRDDGRSRIYQYDVFGNLVEVWSRQQVEEHGEVAVLLAGFTYDALGHRVSARYNRAYLDGSNPNDVSLENDDADLFAYDEMWRVVGVVRKEMPSEAYPQGRSWLRQRYVYHNVGSGTDYSMGKGGSDAPLLRMIDADGDGAFETQHHFLCDKQGSVVAIVGPGPQATGFESTPDPTTGPLIARVNYSPYGEPTLCRPSDMNRDGIVEIGPDGDAWESVIDPTRAASTIPAEAARWSQLADFDLDGVFNATMDDAAFQTQLAVEAAYPRVDEEMGDLPLYGGYWWDSTLRLYHVRHRVYDPEQERWLQRDPIGYAGGWNLYEYVGSQPGRFVDPMGLWGWDGDWFESALRAAIGATGFGGETNAAIATAFGQGAGDGAMLITDHAVGAYVSEVRDSAERIRAEHAGEWEYAVADVAAHVGVESAKLAAMGALGQVAGCGTIAGQTAKLGFQAIEAVDTLNVVLDAANVVNAIQNGDWATARAGAMDLALNYLLGRAARGLGNRIVCFTPETAVQTPDGLTPITELRVGDRVLTGGGETGNTSVDPKTWRHYTLACLDEVGRVVCVIELLRPEAWLEENRIGSADLGDRCVAVVHLELKEFGLSVAAAVMEVKPCPAIKPGPGRVVLMTSRTLSKDLVSLKLAGAAAAIAATDTHPVYSEDRAAFVPVGSLAVGERVRTADGWAMVESLAREGGDGRPTLVCNLEVEGEHTFLVGELGLVSHNDSVVGGRGGCGARAGALGLKDHYLGGSGGRWGSGKTRRLNDRVASRLEESGWTVRGGAGRASEEWISGRDGGTVGGTWVDITATRGGKTLRIQTITTRADGITPTAAEIAAAARIQRAFPGDTLLFIPK